MGYRKNVKRNATRPHAKDKGLVSSMQRSYPKPKPPETQPELTMKLL